jgi:hypothetical protein
MFWTLHGLEWSLLAIMGPLVFWRAAGCLGHLEGLMEGTMYAFIVGFNEWSLTRRGNLSPEISSSAPIRAQDIRHPSATRFVFIDTVTRTLTVARHTTKASCRARLQQMSCLRLHQAVHRHPSC